jgi:hypothetical protein
MLVNEDRQGKGAQLGAVTGLNPSQGATRGIPDRTRGLEDQSFRAIPQS